MHSHMTSYWKSCANVNEAIEFRRPPCLVDQDNRFLPLAGFQILAAYKYSAARPSFTHSASLALLISLLASNDAAGKPMLRGEGAALQ